MPHLPPNERKEIQSSKPSQTFSILPVTLPKGECEGIWEGKSVTAYDRNGNILCSFRVHDNSPQANTKCLIYNYPRTGAIINSIIE